MLVKQSRMFLSLTQSRETKAQKQKKVTINTKRESKRYHSMYMHAVDVPMNGKFEFVMDIKYCTKFTKNSPLKDFL